MKDEGRNEAYEAAWRRLLAHPGYQAHAEHEAFDRSLHDVFVPNARELMRLVDRAATDPDLAMELVQNAHDDTVAREFHSAMTQRFHNYLASTMSLVEHSRRLKRHLTEELVDTYADRKAELLENAEIEFFKDLRVYVQHRTIPPFLHSVALNTRAFESDVELGAPNLLRWKKWSAVSRRFLLDLGDRIAVRPLVKKHGQLVYSFNSWLLDALYESNRERLDEANRLVVECNAALMGVGYAEAEAVMDRHEADVRQRRSPTPFAFTREGDG